MAADSMLFRSVIFPLLLISCFQTGLSQRSDGETVIGVYELRVGNFSVKLTNLGATLMSVILPDKHGKLADVALGFDSAREYQNDTTYFGALVGRVANRIAGAQFTLNGTRYKLDANEGKNILHGGKMGFSRRIWSVKKYSPKAPSPLITFTYFSHDGEEGFPGDLNVKVTYKITSNYRLHINMKAKPTNKPTPVNLAQHTYWNLRGHNTGSILSNTVQIFGSRITPVNNQLIPTGTLTPVKNTPYDFLKPHTVINNLQHNSTGGYDINYVLDRNNPPMRLKPTTKLNIAAAVEDRNVSGRRMEVWTNQPGVQFYTGDYVSNVKGKNKAVYNSHAGLCLETQDFPDAVNHPNFPDEIVNPGQTYKHIMLFKFSVVE